MRLIRCHIENFGKLHDYTVDFMEGANIICEENGWGKSTLAAFIRAMFYGLEGERKRSIEENERKRYTPWQGGVFGGQLTFEIDEKQYVVTRTFHEHDEFELRDAKTNLISSDFSKNLGEELFKVDRASFLRTVFIGQSDCETAVTDDVNAKIGNLTENSNDLNNFEAASTRLKELINSLTPSRKTGSISQRKSEITELERKVAVQKGIPDALQKLQEKRMDELQEYNQLKVELDSVQEEQMRVSKLQRTLAKKEQWERLKQELQEVHKPFTGDIPRIEEVEVAQLNESEMKKASERLAMYEMTEGEKEQLASLQLLFDKGVPEGHDFTEKLDEVKTLNHVRRELLEEQLEQAKRKAEQEQQKNTGTLSVGVIILILGVIAIVIGVIAPMTVVVGIGVAVTLVGVIMTVIRAKNNKVSKDVAQESEDETCAHLEKRAEQLQQTICKFLEAFEIYAEEDAFANLLHELKTKANQYGFLENKKKNLLQVKADYERNFNQICDFLMQYGFEPAHNIQLQLLKIRDDVQSYTEALRKLEIFEQETDTSYLKNISEDDKSQNLSDLNEKIKFMTDEREAIYTRLEGYQADIEQLQAQLDEWEENKIRLVELKVLQEQEQQKYDYILKVQDYLAKAKESITNRYSAPILESFSKYYEMITSASSEMFHIDANTNITLTEQGKQRETNALSSGYRDLIGICLRVALVDAMYQEELPILIMDDPFTNLDDEKMAAAKKFLEHVAQKYQVIYFTCSQSRT